MLVFDKYTNFVNILLSKLALLFLEYMEINNYIIYLTNNLKLPYNLLFNLKQVGLKQLNIYIKIFEQIIL